MAPRPRVRVDVHVLVLERDRQDQVLAAGQDAARLRPQDVLAAAERDEVGALVDQRVQVLGRRQRHRRVDDDGQIVGMGDRHDVRERQVRDGVVAEVEQGGRVRPDRLLELVGEWPLGEADLDQLRACDAQQVVVVVAMAPQHDDLVGHAGRVGQAVHARRVEARDRGGGRHGEARCGARGHVGRLGVGGLRDDRPGPRLEVLDADEVARGLGHRLDDVGVEHGAADLGAVAARVDHPRAAELECRRHVLHLRRPGRAVTGSLPPTLAR